MRMTKNTLLQKAFAITLGVLVLVANPSTVAAQTVQSSTILSVFKPVGYLNGEVIMGATTTVPVDQSQFDTERIKRLDDFFAKRDMPLAGHGAEFVAAAKKCNIDWRLLPAIGVRESSGGKHLMNNNPFGWGSAKIKFDDFSDAIDQVSDNLCGLNDATAKYSHNKTTYERLWYYNGTVLHSYPKEVMDIMDMI